MMMHSSRWWNTLPLYCIKCSYPYWCALSLYSCCSTVSPGDTSIIFLLEKKIFIIQTCKKYLWIKYQENFFPIHIGFKCKHIGFLLLRFLFFSKPKFIYIDQYLTVLCRIFSKAEGSSNFCAFLWDCVL